MNQAGSDQFKNNTDLPNKIEKPVTQSENLKTKSYWISVTENGISTQYQDASNGQLAEVSSQPNANTEDKENISTVKPFKITNTFDSKTESAVSSGAETSTQAQKSSNGLKTEASDQ